MDYSQPSTSTAPQFSRDEKTTQQNMNADTPEGRLALKFNYMTLLDEANEIIGNQNLRANLHKINNVIDKAAEMFTKVNDTTAMFMDAKVFHCTTTSLEHVTENIDVGEGVFKLLPFAEHFKMKSLNSNGRPCWNALAEVAPPVVQNSLPHWTPLLGSFEFSFELPASPQRKARQQRQRDRTPEKIVPTKDPQGENTQVGVEKMVQHVFEKLKKHYKINKKPLNYFRFVVNPDSFADTVENIFHVSFLINDGHAQLQIARDGYPAISPVEDKENTSPGGGTSQVTERKQMIMPMNMELWEALILVFNIKSAMI